jgi:hypothetical protein
LLWRCRGLARRAAVAGGHVAGAAAHGPDEPRSFIGLDIERDWQGGTISISQPRLIAEALCRYGFADGATRPSPLPDGANLTAAARSAPLPAERRTVFMGIVGTLLYIANMTRPDLCFTATALARHMAAPTVELLKYAEHALRYLKGTKDIKLVLGGSPALTHAGVPRGPGELQLYCYGDADFANCGETRRSITGYAIMLNGSAVIFGSKKQTIIAKSTAVAEVIAQSFAADQAVIAIKICHDLGSRVMPVPLLCDNWTTAGNLNNPVESGATKYIDLQWLYVREMIAAGKLTVHWIEGAQQLADVFTKPLTWQRMVEMRKWLGLAGEPAPPQSKPGKRRVPSGFPGAPDWVPGRLRFTM